MNNTKKKVSLFMLFSNLVSVINLISLMTILNQEDTPFALKLIVSILLLALLFQGRNIPPIKDFGVILFALDINLNLKQGVKEYKFQSSSILNVMKYFYLVLYIILLYCHIEFKPVYAIGLVGVETYFLILGGNSVFFVIKIMCLSLRQVFSRFLFLQIPAYQFFAIPLSIYTISSIILAYFFKSCNVFTNFKEIFSIMFATFVGVYTPFFKDNRTNIQRIVGETLNKRQGFFAAFDLVLGYLIYEDLSLEFKILYLVCIPFLSIKIYEQIKYLINGPHQIILKINQNNSLDNTIKVKNLQYLTKLEFSQLTNDQIKQFLKDFIEFNPNTYFEYSKDGIQHLQLDQRKCFYSFNPVDLDSFKLQFKMFYKSKILYKQFKIFIKFNQCYQQLGQFETDRIILNYPLSILYRYTNTGINYQPSEFIRQYYLILTKTLYQRMSLDKISYHIPINKNQLFYDLFDDFY
ncbi:hypothetical protein ABPG74_011492 [Tetrahymena malaccensis]